MDPNQEPSLFGMEVDITTQNQLNSISKWGKFIAITGFIFAAIMILLMAAGGQKLVDAMYSVIALGGVEALWILIAIMVVFFGLCGAWLFFLLRTANLLRKGLLSRNAADLAEGFKSLRSFFITDIVVTVLILLINLFNILKG